MAASPQRADLDIGRYKSLLESEHNRLAALHKRERNEIIGESEDASENELSSTYTFTDPADNADTAAVLNDDERENALDANDLSILKQVDHALDRIREGTYGICEITGKPIPVARLNALPWATTTVEAADRAEL